MKRGWTKVIGAGFRVACAECGLVHWVDIRVKAGRVECRVTRHNRATARPGVKVRA